MSGALAVLGVAGLIACAAAPRTPVLSAQRSGRCLVGVGEARYFWDDTSVPLRGVIAHARGCADVVVALRGRPPERHVRALTAALDEHQVRYIVRGPLMEHAGPCHPAPSCRPTPVLRPPQLWRPTDERRPVPPPRAHQGAEP